MSKLLFILPSSNCWYLTCRLHCPITVAYLLLLQLASFADLWPVPVILLHLLALKGSVCNLPTISVDLPWLAAFVGWCNPLIFLTCWFCQFAASALPLCLHTFIDLSEL